MTTLFHAAENASNPIDRGLRSRTAFRVLYYFAGKLLALFVMVAVSALLIILIGNFGGYIDKMVKAEIDFQVGQTFRYQYTDLPTEERLKIIQDYSEQMYEQAGLNEPFLQRTLRWFWMAIRLDLGSPLGGSPFFPSVDTSVTIAQVLLARLPATLLLFGFSNLVIFITSVTLGLIASQKFDSRLDKFIKAAAPLSAIPPWFYGILLGILLFRLGLSLSTWLMLFIALFLGSFFHSAYAWRSFFIIYSNEDYLDFAKAQGIPRGKFLRRYLIQPTLPTLMTNFALSIIGFWVGSIILEPMFNWPGIGALFVYATTWHDTSILVSVVVVFAYLLAFTIFFLEIGYLLVDPRIRMQNNLQLSSPKRRGFRWSKPHQMRAAPADTPQKKFSQTHRNIVKNIGQWFYNQKFNFQRIRAVLSDLNKNPAARRSVRFITFTLIVTLLIVIGIPYKQAIRQWRGDGNIFMYQPREAQPRIVNWFRDDKLPETIIINTAKGEGEKIEGFSAKGNKEYVIKLPIVYPYSALPQDMVLFFDAKFTQQPLYILYWLTPEGDKIKLADFTGPSKMTFYLSQEEEIRTKLKTKDIQKALFMSWADQEQVVQGTYTLELEAYFFEPDAQLDVELVMRGQVFGLLGTDNERRDNSIELAWGLPIVLAFGLLGAVFSNILSMVIAAASAWYGGWLDNLIQRITEINLALPAFPISLLIFYMYSKSIWVILLVIVALNIFGPALKSYRSTFLEVRESPYIEAAIAYGANDKRLIFRYMVPRIFSILVPRIVVDMPSFVFLEAALAYLGLSDPVFPTWGKMILKSLFNLRGSTYAFLPQDMMWYTHIYISIIFPVLTLILLALSFNTLGSYLEKYLNPKLRET